MVNIKTIAKGNCYLYKLPDNKTLGFIVYDINVYDEEKYIHFIVVGSEKSELKSVEDFRKSGIVYTNNVFNGLTLQMNDGLFMLDLMVKDRGILDKLVFIGQLRVNEQKARLGSSMGTGMLIEDLNNILATLNTDFMNLEKKSLNSFLIN